MQETGKLLTGNQELIMKMRRRRSLTGWAMVLFAVFCRQQVAVGTTVVARAVA